MFYSCAFVFKFEPIPWVVRGLFRNGRSQKYQNTPANPHMKINRKKKKIELWGTPQYTNLTADTSEA